MNKDIGRDIGRLVAVARKRAGYKTIYAFCRATGISTGHMSDLENGTSSPSIATLEKIFGTIGWEVRVTFRPAK